MSPHPDIPALLAEIGDRKKMHDRFVMMGPRYLMQTIEQLSELLRTTHEARVRVEEALKPLARCPDQVLIWNKEREKHDAVSLPDEDRAAVFTITYGDIRKARAALSLPQGET